MNLTKIILIVELLMFSAFFLSAQTNDAQLWTDIKITHKLSGKINGYAENGLRFSENISEIGTAYSEIGLEYKLLKKLEISGGYRFFSKRKNEDLYSNRHRLNLDLSYKTSYYLFSIQLKTRVEMEYKNILSSNSGMIPEFQWRNKAQLKYNFTKKIKPFFYLEAYLPLSNSEYFEIEKMKYCIGGEYKINKHNSFELYYLYEGQLHQNNPNKFFVTGISYICSF
jgi:hypothetical protein